MTNEELAEAKALLVAAKAKIATPESWTKHALAKSANDLMVYTTDPAACKFCVLGAIRTCTPSNGTAELAKRLLRNQIPCSGQFQSLPGYNDNPSTTRRHHANLRQSNRSNHMTTEKDVLIAARRILATPAHWTKDAFARDVRNKPVAFQSAQACQFCTIGALRRATLELVGPTPARMELASKASGLLQSSLPKGAYSVETFNDNLKTTHKDVLKLFDKAIAS